MYNNKQNITTIGIVLSTVPGYSETFFRNKIKGLQSSGFEVVLFVDYTSPDDHLFPCKVVAATDVSGGFIKTVFNSVLSIIKAIIYHPKRSMNLYYLDKKDGKSLQNRLKFAILNQFFLKEKLDWLHFGFGMLANERENVAEAMDAKMAVSFRGYDLYLSPLKHRGCYDLLFQKNAQYHVLSEEMKHTLIDYKINPNKIKVITPAIDVSFFQASNKPDGNNAFVKIVTVARLHWKKGLEYTLEALMHLKQAGVKFHYTIIGDGEEYERLIFAAYQMDIMECITFAGKVAHNAVKEHLEESDIYLQYSIQEGFCNAVLEAQAMGLLCIVSNAEGLSENVLNNETGWVVPKRKPRVLAQKINDVLHLNAYEKQRIRSCAVTRVRNEFNLEKQNQAFADFYNER